jgi:rhodanese-related sulfurtransferase
MRINIIFAIAAFILGLSAVFTDFTGKNSLYPTWKFNKERIDKKKVDLISANHLADLIYNKEKAVLVVDVRSSEEYGKYHIPDAVLFNESTINTDLPDAKKIILVGKADLLVQAKIYKTLPGSVYILDGGIPAWYDMVLFPDFEKLQVRNKQVLDHILARSKYFGGKPVNTETLNLNIRTIRFREGC